MANPRTLSSLRYGLACTILLLVHSLAASAADESAFRRLFNGVDFTGWDGDTNLWRIEAGILVGQTTASAQPAGRKSTFLVFRDAEFSNFELRFQYKVTGFHSGVQYRSIDKGGWLIEGLQAEFEDRWQDEGRTDRYSGVVQEEEGRSRLAHRGQLVVIRNNPDNRYEPRLEPIASVGDPAELEKSIRRNAWNDYTVFVQGNHYIHIINGRVMAMAIDEDEKSFRRSGFIGFQLPAGPPVRVEIREVRLRALR